MLHKAVLGRRRRNKRIAAAYQRLESYEILGSKALSVFFGLATREVRRENVQVKLKERWLAVEACSAALVRRGNGLHVLQQWLVLRQKVLDSPR